MFIVETIAKIRRRHFVEGKKIKEICRDLGVSRNTVRKILRGGATEHRYKRNAQPMPRLGNYVTRVEELLEHDWTRPKKRRLTGRRLFELLQAEGYGGGYDSIQRFASKWREQKNREPVSGFVPLSFGPGEAYQFDWSTYTIPMDITK